MARKKKNKNRHPEAWAEAKKRFHLTDEHIRMAKALNLNPKKFGKYASNQSQPWKAPLGQFIEHLYQKQQHKRKKNTRNSSSTTQPEQTMAPQNSSWSATRRSGTEQSRDPSGQRFPGRKNHKNHDPFYKAIDVKLAAIAQAAATPPLWYQRWSGLEPEASGEERLAVFQAIRNAEVLPQEAGFYLVAWQVDALAERDADVALHELEEQLKNIRAAYGLAEEESWLPGETPLEYEEVYHHYHDSWDNLFAEQLDLRGEPDMARLFRTDRRQFEQIHEKGRAFFYEPDREDDAEWLATLLDTVVTCLEAQSEMGPLGLRYHHEEDFWDIVIYPTPVELLGGAHDGAVVTPGFSLDLEALRQAFDSVSDLGWNALGWPYGHGPHIWVEGVYQGRPMYVQVLAQAPEDEEPGWKLDTTARPPAPP